MQFVALPDHSWPAIDATSLVTAAGATSYDRGVQYLREGAVTRMSWDRGLQRVVRQRARQRRLALRDRGLLPSGRAVRAGVRPGPVQLPGRVRLQARGRARAGRGAGPAGPDRSQTNRRGQGPPHDLGAVRAVMAGAADGPQRRRPPGRRPASRVDARHRADAGPRCAPGVLRWPDRWRRTVPAGIGPAGTAPADGPPGPAGTQGLGWWLTELGQAGLPVRLRRLAGPPDAAAPGDLRGLPGPQRPALLLRLRLRRRQVDRPVRLRIAPALAAAGRGGRARPAAGPRTQPRPAGRVPQRGTLPGPDPRRPVRATRDRPAHPRRRRAGGHHRDLVSSARRAMAWSTPTGPKPSAPANASAGDSSWPGRSSPSRRSCSRWRWPGSGSRSRPRS